MIIRVYQETDRTSVVALWNEVFQNPLPHNDPHNSIDRKVAQNDGLFLVAVDGSLVVGTVMAGYDGHRGWIYSLAVTPERRRQRIGTALMRRVESELLERGCPKINLQVLPENEEVIAFYRQLDYDVELRISMGKRAREFRTSNRE